MRFMIFCAIVGYDRHHRAGGHIRRSWLPLETNLVSKIYSFLSTVISVLASIIINVVGVSIRTDLYYYSIAYDSRSY